MEDCLECVGIFEIEKSGLRSLGAIADAGLASMECYFRRFTKGRKSIRYDEAYETL